MEDSNASMDSTTSESEDPFNEHWFSRLWALMRSADQDKAKIEVHKIYDQTQSHYKANGWTEHPSFRIKHTEINPGQRIQQAPMQLHRPKPNLRSNSPDIRQSPTTSSFTARPAKRSKPTLQCCKCKDESSLDNQIVPCTNCDSAYHQTCHSPVISSTEMQDPAFVFSCSKCQEKDKVQLPIPNLTRETLSPKLKPKTKPALSSKSECAKCEKSGYESGNILVQCKECLDLYHQNCTKPKITEEQLSKASFAYHCMNCQVKAYKKVPKKTDKASSSTSSNPSATIDAATASLRDRISAYKAKQEREDKDAFKLAAKNPFGVSASATPSQAMKAVQNMRKKQQRLNK